jgi:hypothetical protein
MTIVGGYCANKRNARQLQPQVRRVALALLGVVQDGVDIVEDVPLADGGVVVADAELFLRPVGDVLPPVAAVFGVGVEGKALGIAGKVKVWNSVACEGGFALRPDFASNS